MLAAKGPERPAVLVYVARDGQRQALLENGLAFAAPDVEVLSFPAWDCQPYDRVSPNPAVAARRMTVLSRLARSRSGEDRPRILTTTVNAIVQRVPRLKRVAGESFSAAPGNMVDVQELAAWLETNGFQRTSTVRETGEYAVRGGIVDLFAPGVPSPVRLDFFGDTLESIRSFDPETQRTIGQLRALDLVPMSEVQLTTETIRRFRQAYIARFGTPGRDDTLYEAVSEGRRHPGLEHWLPLFQDGLDTLFDYCGGAPVLLDPLAEDAVGERLAQVKDYYDARKSGLDKPAAGQGAPYKPLPPDQLYLAPTEWSERLATSTVVRLTPFARPEKPNDIDVGGRQGRTFAAEREQEGESGGNVFDAAVAHVKALQGAGKRVIVAAWSEGSRERLSHVLADHGLSGALPVNTLAHATAHPRNVATLAIWGLETGFETPDLAVVGEQDILGDRLIRRARKSRRAQDIIAEVGSLSQGDLIVHVDHGIGRFVGLKTIDAAGAPHDCLEIHYAGGAHRPRRPGPADYGPGRCGCMTCASIRRPTAFPPTTRPCSLSWAFRSASGRWCSATST